MKLLICTQAVDKNDPILGFFHRWIEEFAGHAEKIVVVCLRKGEYALPANVEVIALGEKHRVFRAIECMSIAIGRRREYDTVFVHMNPEYVVVAGWLWRLLGKKIGLWYVHKSRNWVLRVALPFVHAVFTVSKDTFPIESSNVLITGHGIDTDVFRPEPQTRGEVFRVVTIGRISEKKNTKLIAGAVLAFSKKSKVSLDIYGEPVTSDEREYARTLKVLLEKDDKEGIIHVRGGIVHDRVRDVLRTADVFVNLGDTGGIDKAVLEACACGVLPVSSNPAHRPFLEKYGLATEKSIDSIVKALERVKEMDSGERAVLSDALRTEVIEHHSLKPLIQKLIWNLSPNK